MPGRGRGGIPTVQGSWLLGSARRLQRDQLGTYEDALRSYGNIARFRVGPPRLGFEFDAVFHPDGARDVLTSRSCIKNAPPLMTEFSRLFGDNLISLDGEGWQSHRRIVQPLLTRQRIVDYLPVIARASGDLVDSWETAARAGRSVDLAEEAMRYALSALGRTLFGGDLQDAAPMLRSEAPALLAHAARRGLSPVRTPASWPTPANRRAERGRRSVYGFVDELIRRRRSEGGDDLLTLLLNAKDPKTGNQLQDHEIRDEALVFFLAGYETTASALAFTLHLLSQHPEAQERVREEAQRSLGGREAGVTDLDTLPYTAQVIDEALRLFPTVPTLVRRTADHVEVLGHTIPPGTTLAVSVWTIHRNPAIWPEPERFDPDRFAPERRGDQDRYAHLPFGSGPRTCVGLHLALAELVMVVAAIVQAYSLRSLDQTPALEHDLTLRPRGALRCELEPVA